MKNTISIMVLAVVMLFSLISCNKEELINPNLSNNNDSGSFDDNTANQRVNNLRVFVYIGTGPGEVEPACIDQGGNCLPDVVITAIAKKYEELLLAIENESQASFFNNNSYGDVFNIDENHQIQEALEKGHLKFKIVKTADADFNLFIKPQHEKFEGSKLANKVVLTIPVVK